MQEALSEQLGHVQAWLGNTISDVISLKMHLEECGGPSCTHADTHPFALR